MKRGVFFLYIVAAWVIGITARPVFGAEQNAFDRLHGGNILQSLDEASRNKGIKVSFDECKIATGNNISTITCTPTSNTAISVALYKESGKVKGFIFGVNQWSMNAAESLDAFISMNNIVNISGRLIRPEIKEETLNKMRNSLIGEKVEALDGKERKVRIDGIMVTSRFVKGMGFLISATADNPQ